MRTFLDSHFNLNFSDEYHLLVKICMSATILSVIGQHVERLDKSCVTSAAIWPTFMSTR